jgi:hypothetical protein
MNAARETGCPAWDPYAVWQILLHQHPVSVSDPAGSCGRIDRASLAGFCETICDYPDFLQDALLVIAHARGISAAILALDSAIRDHLASRADARSLQPGENL